MSKKEIFISSSSEDDQFTKKLVAEIEALGVSCWYAKRDVLGGQSYPSEIARAITECRAFLLVFSVRANRAANENKHILREVELAAGQHKPIFPVRISNVEPDAGLAYFLRTVQWIERSMWEGRLADIVVARTRETPEPTPPSAVARFFARSKRNFGLIAGILAGAVLLVIGTWLAFERNVPVVNVVADPPLSEEQTSAAVVLALKSGSGNEAAKLAARGATLPATKLATVFGETIRDEAAFNRVLETYRLIAGNRAEVSIKEARTILEGDVAAFFDLKKIDKVDRMKNISEICRRLSERSPLGAAVERKYGDRENCIGDFLAQSNLEAIVGGVNELAKAVRILGGSTPDEDPKYVAITPFADVSDPVSAPSSKAIDPRTLVEFDFENEYIAAGRAKFDATGLFTMKDFETAKRQQLQYVPETAFTRSPIFVAEATLAATASNMGRFGMIQIFPKYLSGGELTAEPSNRSFTIDERFDQGSMQRKSLLQRCSYRPAMKQTSVNTIYQNLDVKPCRVRIAYHRAGIWHYIISTKILD